LLDEDWITVDLKRTMQRIEDETTRWIFIIPDIHHSIFRVPFHEDGIMRGLGYGLSMESTTKIQVQGRLNTALNAKHFNIF
jgi:hypothetical protein